MDMQQTDIAIAGAGLTGMILALALRVDAKPALNVAICGNLPDRHDDPRAYAIAPGVKRMLEVLGMWERLEDAACPVDAMNITDSRLEDVVRPQLLQLSSESADGEPVAHIVPAGALTKAAVEALAETDVKVIDIGKFTGFENEASRAILEGEKGSVAARLVVGADGAHSPVRDAAGIRTIGWDYEQSGVVATLKAELPHHNVATQHFLPDGPFALLPLPGNCYSLVCSMPTKKANALAALPHDAFTQEIERRAGADLGDLSLVSGPAAFPLWLALAREFVAPRLALAGDAAHRMHPLAGQGQNMGLRDVAALAEVILDAARLGEDIGALNVLERYQRWRRFDTVQLAIVTDGINRLFSNDSALLRAARDTGLGIVERISGLKSAFIRDAGGSSGQAPRLLMGLPA